MPRIVSIERVRPGEQLAREISGMHGHMLLRAGNKLRQEYLEKLREEPYNIRTILVHDPAVEDVDPQPLFDEAALGEVREAYVKLERLLSQTKSVEALRGREVEAARAQVTRGIEELVKNALLRAPNPHQYTDMSRMNPRLDYHPLNVLRHALRVGAHMDFGPKVLRTLALAALFHDSGKALLREQIKEYPKHPEHSRDVLKRLFSSNLVAAHAARLHHATAEPKQELKLHEKLGRIVGAANAFDHLLHETKGSRDALHALLALFKNTGNGYDHETAKALAHALTPYPVGATVKLETGEFGVVVRVREENASRPVVRILTDNRGKRLEKGWPELDLAKSKARIFECDAPL